MPHRKITVAQHNFLFAIFNTEKVRILIESKTTHSIDHIDVDRWITVKYSLRQKTSWRKNLHILYTPTFFDTNSKNITRFFNIINDLGLQKFLFFYSTNFSKFIQSNDQREILLSFRMYAHTTNRNTQKPTFCLRLQNETAFSLCNEQNNAPHKKNGNSFGLDL